MCNGNVRFVAHSRNRMTASLSDSLCEATCMHGSHSSPSLSSHPSSLSPEFGNLVISKEPILASAVSGLLRDSDIASLLTPLLFSSLRSPDSQAIVRGFEAVPHAPWRDGAVHGAT